MANEEKQEDAAPSVVIPEERPYPKGFRCGYIAVVGAECGEEHSDQLPRGRESLDHEP